MTAYICRVCGNKHLSWKDAEKCCPKMTFPKRGDKEEEK